MKTHTHTGTCTTLITLMQVGYIPSKVQTCNIQYVPISHRSPENPLTQ
jgi:hypothetical protein